MMQQMKAKTLNSVESFSNRKITVFPVYSTVPHSKYSVLSTSSIFCGELPCI